MSTEIINSRVIAAPRATVFAAFAEPRSLEQWWGPNGFTNKVTAFDFRPGGTWRIVMRAPDGTEYNNESRFSEVREPEVIVYEHLGPMHRFQMTMTFDAASATTTTLTWRMQLERSSENEKLRPFLSQANEQNFDRLCAFIGRPRGHAA